MQTQRPKWGLGELLKNVPRTQDAELDPPEELPAITLNDIESEIKILWNDVVYWEAEQEKAFRQLDAARGRLRYAQEQMVARLPPLGIKGEIVERSADDA